MLQLILASVGGLCGIAPSGCGPGLREPTAEIGVVRTVGPKGANIQLGPASLAISQGALADSTPVTFRRVDYQGSGAVGPVFELTIDGSFNNFAEVAIEISLPNGGEVGGRGPALAYRVADVWERFNDQVFHYDSLRRVIWGRLDRLKQSSWIVGPVVACGHSGECPPSGNCVTGACQ